MSAPSRVTVTTFATAAADVFRETFERPGGGYLDRGTSLFDTLRPLTADIASRPVSASCSNIAAQVNHITYYLDVLMAYLRGRPPEGVDW